ncbi:hypothetical protein CSUI_005541, partial [Cystoisospora suis]
MARRRRSISFRLVALLATSFSIVQTYLEFQHTSHEVTRPFIPGAEAGRTSETSWMPQRAETGTAAYSGGAGTRSLRQVDRHHKLGPPKFLGQPATQSEEKKPAFHPVSPVGCRQCRCCTLV